MKRLYNPFLAITFLACFLFVSLALTSQTAAHALHHAHHKATTHASLLCSWVCSAGQVLQAFEFWLYGPFLTLIGIHSGNPSTTNSVIAWSPPSRAPPISSATS